MTVLEFLTIYVDRSVAVDHLRRALKGSDALPDDLLNLDLAVLSPRQMSIVCGTQQLIADLYS